MFLGRLKGGKRGAWSVLFRFLETGVEPGEIREGGVAMAQRKEERMGR